MSLPGEARYIPKSRWEAAAVGNPDGAGSGGADGGEAGDRADLRGGISNPEVMGSVRRRVRPKERISDRRVLKLVRQWLEAGVMEDGTVRETLAGTPQGNALSTHGVAGQGSTAADRAGDGPARIATASSEDAVGGFEAWEGELRIPGMHDSQEAEHPAKPSLAFVQRWPSPKATKKLRARVRELTDKRQSGKDVKQIIAELTPVLRGWGNYFRTGNADGEFNKMDAFVEQSLRRWQYRRGGQRPTTRPKFTRDQLYGMGLHRLMGTVKYPTQTTQVRSSLSRVQENRTHDLKGVC